VASVLYDAMGAKIRKAGLHNVLVHNVLVLLRDAQEKKVRCARVSRLLTPDSDLAVTPYCKGAETCS
jgi:hypothetical protein